MKTFLLLILLLKGLLASVYGHTPAILKDVKFDQKLGSSLSQNILASDETGTVSSLAGILVGKPGLFVFSYGDCKTLCSLVLNGVIKGLNDVQLSAGRDFQVIVLSIDPNETFDSLRSRKRMVGKRYLKSKDATGWHFLRADADAIKQAASDLGFNYAYDPQSKEYAHASGIVFLTPAARVSSYLLGIQYPPKALEAELTQAARSRSGNLVADLLLYCFHYDPSKDKYGQLILTALKVSGLVMVFAILVGIYFLSRPKRRKA